jgi:hypothetical protein
MTVCAVLHKNLAQVYIGFRPHEKGVSLEIGGKTYRPQWCLQSDLHQELEIPGPPSFWATDGHRITFDKPAAVDCIVFCDKEPPCPIG